MTRKWRRLPRNNSQRIKAIQGWRTIGGKRNYYRSKQEANHARFLEFQKQKKLIKDWQHEPKTFWFDAIKRGINNYKPDFLVIHLNDQQEWHEVKGWMCSKSKTKIKRFRKYYPNERLIIYDSKTCYALKKSILPFVKDLE